MEVNKKQTVEEIEAKAQKLSEAMKVKVTPVIFSPDDGVTQVVAYLKEPTRIVKMRALDKMTSMPVMAGEELLLTCLVKEESDPRILSESSGDDKIYFGACYAALRLVEVSLDQYKKK